MYKRTVAYKDFDGNERKEDLYFNLSVSEVTDMELSYPGGFANLLDSIVKSNDKQEIYKMFKSIVDKAYGEKSPDGKYFRKSAEILNDFKSSGAYDQFMIDLLADGGNTAAAFVNGIMPNGGTVSSEDLNEKTKQLIDTKKLSAQASE